MPRSWALLVLLFGLTLATDWDTLSHQWLSSQHNANTLLLGLIRGDRFSSRVRSTSPLVSSKPLQRKMTTIPDQKGIRIHSPGALMFEGVMLSDVDGDLLINSILTNITGGLSAAFIDTGNGPTEIFAMNQDVTTDSNAIFRSLEVTGAVSWNTKLPDMRFNSYTQEGLRNYITMISSSYTDAEAPVVSFAHGVTADSRGYAGGVYSPTQNRIYLVPIAQAENTEWHYIDGEDGSVVAYTHGVTADSSAYGGGVYSPTQNRIYLVPYTQADNPEWHYIDCEDGSVVAYTHGVAADVNGYYGGVYSPTQNRIYLVPYEQSDNPEWHYIQPLTHSSVSVSLMSGALFNNL